MLGYDGYLTTQGINASTEYKDIIKNIFHRTIYNDGVTKVFSVR